MPDTGSIFIVLNFDDSLMKNGNQFKRIFITALIIALMSSLGCRNHSSTHLELPKDLMQPENVLVIPFKLTESNNISVTVTINGKDKSDLMFHTGVNSVSLTREACERPFRQIQHG